MSIVTDYDTASARLERAQARLMRAEHELTRATEERDQAILAMADAGGSQREIAEAVGGMSHVTVGNILRRMRN